MPEVEQHINSGEFKEIFELAGQINELQQEAVRQTLSVYEAEVEQIVLNKITDRQRIENALDQLLEVAFDENVLVTYKKLCRHYYFINPEAAVFYVQSYREVWDEESLEIQSSAPARVIDEFESLKGED